LSRLDAVQAWLKFSLIRTVGRGESLIDIWDIVRGLDLEQILTRESMSEEAIYRTGEELHFWRAGMRKNAFLR
jgi:hypothetical protein